VTWLAHEECAEHASCTLAGCATDYNSGTRLYTMTLDFSMRDLPDKVARVHAKSAWQTIVIFFFPSPPSFLSYFLRTHAGLPRFKIVLYFFFSYLILIFLLLFLTLKLFFN
jgi:hypothetical protein